MYSFLLLLLVVMGGTWAQFSKQAQQDLVDAHNALRSKIALGQYVAKGTTEPPAANMKKIRWNTTLAASAQKYTNTCPSGHSQKKGVGENIYWMSTTGKFGDLNPYAKKAAAAWEDEFQKYGWTSVLLDGKTWATGIGHATAMAWAETSALGCGVKNCGPDPKDKKWTKLALVCQYWPQGNVIPAPIYNIGPTCSNCTTGTKCEKATGLCA